MNRTSLCYIVALVLTEAHTARAGTPQVRLRWPVAEGHPITYHFCHGDLSGLDDGRQDATYDCSACNCPICSDPSFIYAGHTGTDINVVGQPVYAAASGTVTQSASNWPNERDATANSGMGNHVILSHGEGVESRYYHLQPNEEGSAFIPEADQAVACGTQIGVSGQSGNAFGSHLHFGVTVDGQAYDPFAGPCNAELQDLLGGEGVSFWTDQNGGAPTAACASYQPGVGTGSGESTGEGSVGGGDQAALVSRAPEVGAVFQGGVPVEQHFVLQNTGTTTWATAEYRLVRIDDTRLNAAASLPLLREVIPAAADTADDQALSIVELVLHFVTPQTGGRYRGTWQMEHFGVRFGPTLSIDITVSAAPGVSCHSQTLGTSVAHGECVQVAYGGCSLSACGVYRCLDGAWFCTSVDVCEAFYAHAECLPPEEGGGSMEDGATSTTTTGGGTSDSTVSSPYCGDGSCSNGEGCSDCAADCGACSSGCQVAGHGGTGQNGDPCSEPDETWRCALITLSSGGQTWGSQVCRSGVWQSYHLDLDPSTCAGCCGAYSAACF